MEMPVRKRLSREEWTRAALAVMGEHGVDRVAVEPLAKELGATKGSFYWHFRDRDDLIMAALERWEQEETEGVIAALGAVAGGTSRLHQLLTAIVTPADRPDRSVVLAADVGHPAVAEVLTRVTERRIAYVAAQLEAAGLGVVEARRRALVAYTSYLGYSTLRRSAPDVVPAGAQAEAYVETMMRLLTDLSEADAGAHHLGGGAPLRRGDASGA